MIYQLFCCCCIFCPLHQKAIKKSAKISSAQAANRLVRFVKVCPISIPVIEIMVAVLYCCLQVLVCCKSIKNMYLDIYTSLSLKLKEGASLTTFLEKVDARQPFLLCVGEQRKDIQRFFIVVDQKPIPCSASTSVAAFDDLFKAHFVFSLSYDEALSSFYTFIQTTVYNIDVGSTKESPRVKELRARLLQER